jgi:hypothetical protein
VTRNKPLIFKLGVASLSLFAAVLVYSFTRIYPPELLSSIQATHPGLAAQTGIFGSAPSFFYTLALGLFIGACASTLTNARVHCLVWIGLAICLELTQHPIAAELLSTWLAAILSKSSWELIGPYWTRGAFDQLDLVATLIGGFVALTLLTYLPREIDDAHDL